jgi:peptidoglycan/LPS O-acetylase OafA/YrhL
VKLREIERLRAIAVLMVVFAHAAPAFPYLGGVFAHPRTGVDIFFVISGFVVTRSLLRLLPETEHPGGLIGSFDASRRALRVFYTRRFFRIAPLVVAVVALQGLFFVIGLPTSVTGGDINGYWREVCAIFDGVYNYAMPNEGYNQFGVFWSLSVEEHFYLILPVLFVALPTRSKRLALSLSGIGFVAFVCRTFFGEPPPGFAQPEYYRIMTSHLRFDNLLAGVALALLFDGPESRAFMPKFVMKWFVLPICIALVWAIPRSLPTPTYFHQGFISGWFLSGVLVGYAALDRGYVLDIPVLRNVLEYIGSRSYAVYLLHIPALRLLGLLRQRDVRFERFAVQSPWLNWGFLVLVTLAASEVSWQLLEAPMQRLGKRLIEGKGKEPKVATAG